MRIQIDTNLSTPLFNQLMDQIKKAVMDGLLNPGDPLPSIRQLANDLELNHNTVAAYWSVIQSFKPKGIAVHPSMQMQNKTALSI